MATKADIEALTGERGELVERLMAVLAERNAEIADRQRIAQMQRYVNSSHAAWNGFMIPIGIRILGFIVG